MWQPLKVAITTLLSERSVAKLSAIDHYFRGEPELRILRRLCEPGHVALDIGANIGTYTHFLRKYGMAVRAYEPNPYLAQRLARIYPDVTVRQVAVSNQTASTTLRIPVVDGRAQHELASVRPEYDPNDVVTHDVECTRIDDEELTDVKFIKIDVEQHELQVLAGALHTIERCQPVILTECTPLKYDQDVPTMFQFLTELGYEGFFRFDGAHHPFSEFDAAKHADAAGFGHRFMDPNLIFFPRELDGTRLLAG